VKGKIFLKVIKIRRSRNNIIQKFGEKYQKRRKKWQWKILFSFGFLYFFYYFGRENIGFIIPLLKEEYGWSSYQLGVVSAGLFWTYAIGQLFWGKLSDRIGGGRVLCGVGGLLSMVLNWICSFATSSIMTLAIPWTANGLAQSMGWAPGNKLLANWWPRKERGSALGLVLSFTGIAMIVLWALSGWIGTHWGWKGLFRIPVILLGIMSIAFILLVKDHPRQVNFLNYKEEDLEAKNGDNIYKNKWIEPYLNMLRIYEFGLACLTAGMANFARYFFTIWIPLYYFEVGGFPLEKVALISIALPIGMSIGPLIAGWVSDKFFEAQRYPVIIIFLSISAGSTFILGFVSVNSLVWSKILLFLVGFSVYGLQGPIYALSTDIAGRNQSGTATGIMDSVSYIIGSLQGLTIGAILTLSGENWGLAFLFVTVIQLTGIGIAYKAKKSKKHIN
jgi:OPA family glycerol-3-phosphate transporter-like MFS transporter